MKKWMFSLSVLAVCSATVIACGEGDKKTSTPAEGAAAETPASPEYEAGLKLVGQYQCITCHKIDDKLTGPSYKEVAAKYAGADDAVITKLADKVITGGSGVWGQIPMTPHPNVSVDDAKAMVKYILLLNKK